MRISYLIISYTFIDFLPLRPKIRRYLILEPV